MKRQAKKRAEKSQEAQENSTTTASPPPAADFDTLPLTGSRRPHVVNVTDGIKLAPWRTVDIEVPRQRLPEGTHFVGEQLVAAGDLDGVTLDNIMIGLKPQLPAVRASIAMSTYSAENSKDAKFNLDPFSYDDRVTFVITNGTALARSLSLSLIGYVEKKPDAPLSGDEESELARRRKVDAAAQHLVATIAQRMKKPHPDDLQAVYDLFCAHAARFLHDLTGALVAATSGRDPAEDEVAATLVDTLRKRAGITNY